MAIGISEDSVTTKVVLASIFANMDNAYALSCNQNVFHTNTIDGVNVYTMYDFDSKHPAGSKVNDILNYARRGSDTLKVDFSKASSFSFNNSFIFSTPPTADSVQFKITGRITGKHSFVKTTDVVVF